jgi:hypothetical protein
LLKAFTTTAEAGSLLDSQVAVLVVRPAGGINKLKAAQVVSDVSA